MNLNFMNLKKNKKSGFTLLELLIVIAIIAILSVALVLVLNPAETLKKARDSQRISDLSTLKTAIGLYMTTVSPALLGGTANAICKAAPADSWVTTSGSKLSYSVLAAQLTQTTGIDTTLAIAPSFSATPTLTDGTGWIPVNFGLIPGGSPISNLPLDPINLIAQSARTVPTIPASTISAVSGAALVYRYGCAVTPLTFEIDAQLESDAYALTDDKRASDGGNNANLYEVGTSLLILGTGTNL